LHAILEGCPKLKSLDVRNCYIDQSIQSALKAKGIKNLKLPDDSIYTYKFAHQVYYTILCNCHHCWTSSSDDDFDNGDNTGDDDYDSDTRDFPDITYEDDKMLCIRIRG
jgi:hypothetical protein